MAFTVFQQFQQVLAQLVLESLLTVLGYGCLRLDAVDQLVCLRGGQLRLLRNVVDEESDVDGLVSEQVVDETGFVVAAKQHLEGMGGIYRLVDVTIFVSFVAAGNGHDVASVAEVLICQRLGTGAVVWTCCRIHAHRHQQGFAGFLGILLHVVHRKDNIEHFYFGSASFVFLVLFLVGIRLAENELGLRRYAGETAASNALHVGHRTGCSTSGYVRAVVCVGLLQLQGVEYHVGRVEERTVHFLAVNHRLLAFPLGIGHAGHEDRLDAQVAILVFEDGVGAVETGVNDANDDTIAVVGLWQLLARAVLHLVGVSNLSRRIEFRQGFRAYRDIRHSLQLGNSRQLRGCGSDHQHVTHCRLHFCASFGYLCAHLVGVGIRLDVYHEEAGLLFFCRCSTPCLCLLCVGAHHRVQLVLCHHTAAAHQQQSQQILCRSIHIQIVLYIRKHN